MIEENRKINDDFYGGLKAINRYTYWVNMSDQDKSTFFRLQQQLIKQKFFISCPISDIYNPLLHKYSFNIEEFLGGVKTFAFPTVNNLIADLESIAASADDIAKASIADFGAKKSALLNLLREEAFVATYCRILMLPDSNTLQPRKLNSEVIYITVHAIETRISGDDRKGLSSMVDLSIEEDIRLYGKGSVIASVKFLMHTEQENGIRTETWIMEGCVSGQTPLNWVVASIVGPSKLNFTFKLLYHAFPYAETIISKVTL
jgi:hypothetical protein